MINNQNCLAQYISFEVTVHYNYWQTITWWLFTWSHAWMSDLSHVNRQRCWTLKRLLIKSVAGKRKKILLQHELTSYSYKTFQYQDSWDNHFKGPFLIKDHDAIVGTSRKRTTSLECAAIHDILSSRLTVSLPNLAKSKFRPNFQISFCEIWKKK